MSGNVPWLGFEEHIPCLAFNEILKLLQPKLRFFQNLGRGVVVQILEIQEENKSGK